MTLAGILFYVFSFILIASAIMVIAARNSVHSVFFLILCFFNAAALFVLIGAEYIAMTLVIVYVGAVAVLFLFVVMMLNINFAELKQGFLKYLPVGLLVVAVMSVQLGLVFYFSLSGQRTLGDHIVSSNLPLSAKLPAQMPAPKFADTTNTEAIGNILYTDFVYPFQMSGLILLVAMIGAIVLTHRNRGGVRRQSIAKQVSRTQAESIEIIKVKSGQGI
jgi:NADH-quinone oxidoreductase subunit J